MYHFFNLIDLFLKYLTGYLFLHCTAMATVRIFLSLIFVVFPLSVSLSLAAQNGKLKCLSERFDECMLTLIIRRAVQTTG